MENELEMINEQMDEVQVHAVVNPADMENTGSDN